jgi:Protein of unknown function (DUF3570)
VDYRYEFYDEDGSRMQIETHSVYFEQKLVDTVTAKGELTYDGISGATPSGTYVFPASAGKIILDNLHDIRRAVNLNFDCQLGNQTLTPGFAYSKESDYESYGVSLNDAIAFNDKNTILQLGVSHNFDSVLNELISGAPRAWQNKGSTEAIVGISQLLTPKTIFSANFTFGYESGFLSDPYRLVEFIYPGHQFGTVENENRPSVLSKEIFLASITQFITPFLSRQLRRRRRHLVADVASMARQASDRRTRLPFLRAKFRVVLFAAVSNRSGQCELLFVGLPAF